MKKTCAFGTGFTRYLGGWLNKEKKLHMLGKNHNRIHTFTENKILKDYDKKQMSRETRHTMKELYLASISPNGQLLGITTSSREAAILLYFIQTQTNLLFFIFIKIHL